MKSKLVLTICFREKLNRNYLTQKMRYGIFEISQKLLLQIYLDFWIYADTVLWGCSFGRVFLRFVLWICGGAPALECDFNKAAWRLCWDRTSALVFSCGFVTPFHESTSGGLHLHIECPLYINVFPSTHLTHHMCVLTH